MSVPFATVLPLAATPAHATAVPRVAAFPRGTQLPTGVEVPEVIADVAATGVSAPDDVADQLRAVVDRAADNGIDLSIVALDANPARDSELRDLATKVSVEDGGTVLVLSPSWVGSHSDSISRVDLESAQDHTYTGGDSVLAAENFVDELVDSGPPWTLITVLVLLAVTLASAALIRIKLRRGDDSASPNAAATDAAATDAAATSAGGPSTRVQDGNTTQSYTASDSS